MPRVIGCELACQSFLEIVTDVGKAPTKIGAFEYVWCGREDSNPQPSDPKSDALSVEPLPRAKNIPIVTTFRKGKGQVKVVAVLDDFDFENLVLVSVLATVPRGS